MNPGDFFLGDIDGPLIIPASVPDRVITTAGEISEEETVVRKSLQQAGEVRALFEQYKVF